MQFVQKATVCGVILAALSACSLAPVYQWPSLGNANPEPLQFKEAQGWVYAKPQDEAARGEWWKVFNDPVLSEWVARIQVDNNNVQAAQAQYRQALGLLDSARAAYFPTVTGNVSEVRGRNTSNISSTSNAAFPPTNTARLSASLSWELDLWGRIGDNAKAANANAQASLADAVTATLSAQTTFVQSYVQLRLVDEQVRFLDDTLAAYEKSLSINQNRLDAGVGQKSDVTQAQAQLNSTRAQRSELLIQRKQLEHALAVLLGKTPASFTLPPTAGLPQVQTLPLEVPSVWLQRRPDIAAAERRVFAANAQIGVARAALFPALTLSASGGYQGSSFNQILDVSRRVWSIGPALAVTLFDAGAKRAVIDQNIAAYDKSVATYRQTVLTAFQEVEDALSSIKGLDEELQYLNNAAQAADQSFEIAQNQYQAGTVSYLNVVVAQATALSARRALQEGQGRRLTAAVTLLKAMGGGWELPGSK